MKTSENQKPSRNFDLYANKSDALKFYYSQIKPIWLVDGEYFGKIDFDDWVWLPIKDDNKYDFTYCKKYIWGRNDLTEGNDHECS